MGWFGRGLVRWVVFAVVIAGFVAGYNGITGQNLDRNVVMRVVIGLIVVFIIGDWVISQLRRKPPTGP